MCQLKIKRESAVVETVSFTKGSSVSTKDQERERKMWKLLVLHRDQVCQLKIKRESESCGNC